MPQDWIFIIRDALTDLFEGFVAFVPNLAAAIIVFVIGWIISVGIGELVTKLLRKVKFNQVFERGNWKQALERADLKVDASAFLGGIIKWIFVIVFLLAAVDILGLSEFAVFLSKILAYLPNVVVAAFIFVVAVIIADIAEKVLRAVVESTDFGYGHLVSVMVKWSIWIFAILAILLQLQVARELLLTLFTGFVAMIAIAGGLAFGLGGKDVAGEVLQEIKRKLKG